MCCKGKYVYDWPRPMVTVDVVVLALSGGSKQNSKGKVKLLLVKRAKEPFKGKWALPGGFVGINEELETAAARELQEETGLTKVKMKQIHTFAKIGRDPRGRQVTVVYMALLHKRPEKVRGGDDAAEAIWCDINELPSDMAFDHNEIVQFAVEQLNQKAI